MLCEHANEVPSKCNCPEECYCKSHTCKHKLPTYKKVEGFKFLQCEKPDTLNPEALEDLVDALLWAKEQFHKLSNEGHYPPWFLRENGGDGVMPMVRALEKAGVKRV